MFKCTFFLNFMFDSYKQHFFMYFFFFNQKIEKFQSEEQQQTEVICSLYFEKYYET